MDVQLTSDQVLLRDSAAEFLAQECPMERTRAIAEGAHDQGVALWQAISQVGWPGLTLPVEFGGAGMDLLDLAVLFEQTGAALLPGPLFSTVVLGAPCILRAGDAAQQNAWLTEVAQGQLRVALAVLEDGNSWALEELEAGAAKTSAGYRLSGRKRYVLDADECDLLITVARTAAQGNGSTGLSLFAVPRDAPGLHVRATPLLDGTRKFYEVTYENVEVSQEALIGAEGSAAGTLDKVFAEARIALCAEMTGGAQRALDLSVTHARAREQFGKPIGSFQAISHKCADMLVLVESCRSATYYGAWALCEAEADAELSSYLAKAYCSDAFSRVAGDAIQIHGGLGFTWEQDPHLYFRRAKTLEPLLGDAAWNREMAAATLLG